MIKIPLSDIIVRIKEKTKLSDEEIGMVWGAIEFNYENCECASDYGNLCKGCRMWNKLVEGVS